MRNPLTLLGLGLALPLVSPPLVGQAAPAPAPAATGETIQLDAFQVSSERDFGCRKTNAVTATRIGAEIKNIPLNISVISSELAAWQANQP